MASRVIYPPIVESYLPAFNADVKDTNGLIKCKIPFRLSKFNSGSDIKSIHISVVKQNTNKNVVNIDNNADGRYRATGIILNAKPIQDISTGEDDLYYVELSDTDIDIGWTPGWIYKVQIRFCAAADYNPTQHGGQAEWLNAHAADFSEWSNVTTIKAIGDVQYTIPLFNIDTANADLSTIIKTSMITIYSSTLNIFGHFYEDSRDTSELIYSYQFMLYDSNNNLLEDSGPILANQYQDNRSFNYIFKTELEDGLSYKIGFMFETINHYVSGFYKENSLFEFSVALPAKTRVDCRVVTAEYDTDNILDGVTSIHEEEEEGRIGLKLFSESNTVYSGNLCIRRADSRTNFQIWDDIKIIVLKEEYINDLDVIYDYTVESGVWYKYSVQSIDGDGNRGIANPSRPIMRNFNYSFLLGEGNQQLKLMFDNAMSNFKYKVSESAIDSIGSTYPIVTRNASTRYRTFPISGLISFWMDENKLFCNKKVVYNYDDVVELYDKYNKDNHIMQYDYIYERDFRQKVLDFLYDGKIKLFKSPTEGNILVRLTDINCTPVQSLDRMVYSFTGTAYEIAEPTLENYLKYNFYEVGEYASDFSTNEVFIGQLTIDLPVKPSAGDLIAEIVKKYDRSKYNIAGYRKTLVSIRNLQLTFEGKPLKIISPKGMPMIGNKFSCKGTTITLSERDRIYTFDERIIFSPSDELIIYGDEDGVEDTVSIVADFLYEIRSEEYREKAIQTQATQKGVGQIFKNVSPNFSVYNEIYYKYYFETDDGFRRLSQITTINLEADPGTVFAVKDASDNSFEYHEINETGQLVLKDLEEIIDLKYIGVRNPSSSEIDTTKDSDVIINYYYTLVYGTYKKEI